MNAVNEENQEGGHEDVLEDQVEDEDCMVCKSGSKFICFFKIENNFVKPTRVFNL